MLDTKEKYCPVPWTSLYHQLGKNSPCHCIREFPDMTPIHYFNSDKLRSIKESFVNGNFPKDCVVCEKRESLGIKSTRKFCIDALNQNNDLQKFSIDDTPDLYRLELRFSNLCNFKCRMCEPYSSSEIARELFQNGEFHTDDVIKTSDNDIEELKKIGHKIKVLCLTGGEPFLIKEYYDYLDYLIENGLSKNIKIELFTNCSTYNEKFVSRLLEFKSVEFIASIDGVGKTAEYIRHGTKWSVVEKNIKEFAKQFNNFSFNTAISQYTLLDVSRLAIFLMELYNINNDIATRCYAVVSPKNLHFLNMPEHHKQKAYEEIEKATEILKPKNFYAFVKEINDIKNNLKNTPTIDSNSYFEFTEKLDKLRGENFEETFGINLR